MSDYLMRDAAPIGDKGWEAIDEEVVEVVSKNLVARRFTRLVGPLGWGVEQAPVFGLGDEAGAAAASDAPLYVPLLQLEQCFVLKAKHLAMAATSPFGYDKGPIAIAATRLAQAEDKLVLGGLLAAEGHLSAPLGDWDTMGGPFKAVASAQATMRAAGYDGPFAVVLDPGMFARLASLMQHGRRELDLVEKLAGAGVFQSTQMPADTVMVTSPQPWNYDLVVGQDVATAYVGNESLNHRFQIFETLVLRIKRAGSVCVLK
jgi:uncharacterized linocin/CFP29 family protein